MGTMRNFLYHLFCVFRNRTNYRGQISETNVSLVRGINKALFEIPTNYGTFINQVRETCKMRFAGDDTGICFKWKEDA